MKVIATIAVLILVTFAAFYAYVVIYLPGRQLYPKILAMHTNPASRPREHGQLPFLYVSQFYRNSLEGGRDYALYDLGYDQSVSMIRRITKYGVQGGGGPIQDQVEIQSLKSLTSLPSGLSSPDAIPHENLLIVSLNHGSHWKTYYYDRRNLPAQVQPIAQLSQEAYNSGKVALFQNSH